jgi:hypothetical protein
MSLACIEVLLTIWVSSLFRAWHAVRVKEVSASGRIPLRSGSWVARVAGGSSLLAAALLIAALSPTFARQVCPLGPFGCSGLSASLGDSPDAWGVAWIAGTLAATGVLFLAGVSGRLVTTLNALASLAALGLAIFEGVVAFPHVLSAAELVPGGLVVGLGPGYYLFLIGGAVAVGAATAMMLARSDRERATAPSAPVRRWGVVAIGRASLCMLGMALIGTFLPFVTLSCGFGCPPFGPRLALASGGIVAGIDGPVVMTLLAGAGLATAIRITNGGKLVASTAALLLTLAATILVSFDSLNGAERVLGWQYGINTVPDVGYYVLQIATAVGVVLSVLLVTADHPTWGLFRRSGEGRRAPLPTA